MDMGGSVGEVVMRERASGRNRLRGQALGPAWRAIGCGVSVIGRCAQASSLESAGAISHHDGGQVNPVWVASDWQKSHTGLQASTRPHRMPAPSEQSCAPQARCPWGCDDLQPPERATLRSSAAEGLRCAAATSAPSRPWATACAPRRRTACFNGRLESLADSSDFSMPRRPEREGTQRPLPSGDHYCVQL